MTNAQILDQYNLNWNVQKSRLFFQDEKQEFHPTQDFGLVRTDTNIALGVCKKDYHPFQNEVVLQTLRDFADKYNFQITNGGFFNHGKRIFFQIKIDDKLRIGNDTIEEYIFAANSFDKTVQLSFGYTNTVVSCQNSFNRMLKNDVNYRFKHTAGAAIRALEIPELFEQHFAFRQETNETFRKWADIKIESGMIDDLMAYLLATDTIATPEDVAALSTRKANILGQLQVDIAGELNTKGDTLWGLFNGVTYHVNHTRVVKNRDNARLESILVGTGHRMMTKAFEKVAEYAK